MSDTVFSPLILISLSSCGFGVSCVLMNLNTALPPTETNINDDAVFSLTPSLRA